MDGKKVIDGTVVGLGPQMEAVGGIDQLGGDAQLAADLSDTAFQERADPERLADLARVLLAALESERGVARRDLQSGDARERRRDFFRQAVAQVIGVGFAAEIVERQDGDGA